MPRRAVPNYEVRGTTWGAHGPCARSRCSSCRDVECGLGDISVERQIGELAHQSSNAAQHPSIRLPRETVVNREHPPAGVKAAMTSGARAHQEGPVQVVAAMIDNTNRAERLRDYATTVPHHTER